ncbi:MAG: hypothetical protein ACTTIL_08230, partial [Bacteroidia bacterium]
VKIFLVVRVFEILGSAILCLSAPKKQTDICSRMNNLFGIVSIGGDGSACDLSLSLLRGMPVFDSGCSEMDGSAVLRLIATGVWKNSFRPD